MIEWNEIEKREKKALKENLDATGRPLKVGDTVAYAVSLGRSPAVQIAMVHGFSPKGKPQLKIDERFRKKSYSTKEVVTVQYPDRMVIIEPIK